MLLEPEASAVLPALLTNLYQIETTRLDSWQDLDLGDG